MATYLAPGVYVEEVPSAVKPIAGVGTSTAGFVGVVADDVVMPALPGAVDAPTASGDAEGDDAVTTASTYTVADALKSVAINSWAEFERNFGLLGEKNHTLAYAVYGFFQNGGSRCFVVRATKASDIDKALVALEAVDEVAIVAAPLAADTSASALKSAHNDLVAHCQLMEDRVAILDCASGLTDISESSKVGRPAANPKGYGAFYMPWLEVTDRSEGAAAGATVSVPPSGHIAGIYARSDAQRGVHKSPANEVIMGALNTELPVSKIAQGPLNVAGVNVIRNFNGTIKLYGARSLASDPQGDPEWTYIATRRLFNFLRESIEDGTQWVVFEPNSPDLWAKVRRNVNAFLTTVWESGALFGNTPEEAFYVRCDDQTNPPEVRDMGQVVTEIGLSVVKPAEFVIFRISQSAGVGQ